MRRIIFVMMFILAMTLPVVAQDATPVPTNGEQPTASPADDLCFQHNGTIDANSGDCQQRMNLDLVMDYPLELADYPFILDVVDSYYDGARVQFLTNATNSGFAPSPVYNWQLDMSYEIAAQTDSLVSVVFYDYEYTGGAHGITQLQTMNFDLASESELSLVDLFPDGDVPYDAISEYAATVLEERLGKDATFPEGYTPDPENYVFWTLSADGITFHFSQYQVAPYAAGIQVVTVPFDVLGIDVPIYFS